MSKPLPQLVNHILAINPNSSKEMTKGMEKAIEELKIDHLIKVTTYTAPKPAPASINDQEDITESTTAVLSDPNLDTDPYDGILIACFSVHPLVRLLRDRTGKPVWGIFEASVQTAQLLTAQPNLNQRWGIVTTGDFWDDHLSEGVRSCLGQAPPQGTQSLEGSERKETFAGVFTTGLTAGDFHTVSKEEVDRRLTEACQRLFKTGKVTVAIMGCAGMAGLESIIRAAAAAEGGEEEGKQPLYVVDGVKAGVMQLDQMIRSRQVFGPSFIGT